MSVSAKTMSPTESGLWAIELHDRMTALCEGYEQYINISSALDSISWLPPSHDMRMPTAMDAFKSVFRAWLKQQCDLVSERYLGDGYQEKVHIKVDQIKSGVLDLDSETWRKRWDKNKKSQLYQASISEVIDFIMPFIDMNAIHAELVERGESLVAEGYTDVALEIGKKLGLTSYNHHSVKSEVSVRVVKGHYLLNVHNSDEWASSRINQLRSFLHHANLFGEESGSQGLSDIVAACLEEELATQKLTRSMVCCVPSRTRVDVAGTGSAVFFRRRITLHLNAEVFSALVSFIKQYAPESRINLIKLPS